MNVDLPTPGAPVMPTRSAWPVAGSTLAITARASAWWSGRVDSASVIVLASKRRSPLPMPAARRSTSTGSARGSGCGSRAGTLVSRFKP